MTMRRLENVGLSIRCETELVVILEIVTWSACLADLFTVGVGPDNPLSELKCAAGIYNFKEESLAEHRGEKNS